MSDLLSMLGVKLDIPSPPKTPELDKSMNEQQALLESTLQVAVPLHIETMRDLSPKQREKIAHEAALVIASKGDVILYKSKKKGETADAFNHLARGLAAASFCPGGIRFGSLHFES